MAEFSVPNRKQLAAFIKDQQTVIDLEALFRAVLDLLEGRRDVFTKSANYAVPATENNAVYVATVPDLNFTLPPTQAGLKYTVFVKATSTGTGAKVTPQSSDKIMGNGFTSMDGKAAINTGASDREGDFLVLVGDGVDGWFIEGISGTWAREP